MATSSVFLSISDLVVLSGWGSIELSLDKKKKKTLNTDRSFSVGPVNPYSVITKAAGLGRAGKTFKYVVLSC